MPCYKCSNGKWRYGMHGNCQFDTKAACRAAEQAIHARNPKKTMDECSEDCKDCNDCQQEKKQT